ncbi:MAG: DUF971 domain-containing protein [Chloroflexi bacterium]|nr:DUF971 domain-containing protein [Chloroflexota bacterium]
MVDREEVGEYAARFLWSDAHDAGIYSYQYLRSLCRCPQCHPWSDYISGPEIYNGTHSAGGGTK